MRRETGRRMEEHEDTKDHYSGVALTWKEGLPPGGGAMWGYAGGLNWPV